MQAQRYWKNDLKKVLGFERDLNPLSLRNWCNAFQTELSKPQAKSSHVLVGSLYSVDVIRGTFHGNRCPTVIMKT